MKPTIKTTSTDATAKLKRSLEALAKKQVYVGIPEDRTRRNSGAMTNAALAYLHAHGSALQNIPARPFLEPALSEPANKKLIDRELGAAAASLLAEKPAETTEHLQRAGQLASNAAKRYVLAEDHLAPNAPSTVQKKGSSRPLVDTNQLVRSLTYVVDEE